MRKCKIIGHEYEMFWTNTDESNCDLFCVMCGKQLPESKTKTVHPHSYAELVKLRVSNHG